MQKQRKTPERAKEMRLIWTEEMTQAVNYNHYITSGERPCWGYEESQNYAETRIDCNMQDQPGRETRKGRLLMLVNDRRKHTEEANIRLHRLISGDH